jgi:hypothetical protein
MSDDLIPDPHDLVRACLLLWRAQPLEERIVLRRQRQAVRKTFLTHRATLAADPAATPDDLAILDRLIQWADRKLGILPDEEEQRRLDRRRAQTRERMRAMRARQRAAAE